MTYIYALETNFSKDNIARGLCTLVPFITIVVETSGRVLHTVPYRAAYRNYAYCMKPPNIKAPKCTLFSLFSRVKGHKRSPVLPRLIASIVGASLLWRAHFESLRVAEAKNAATINRLMSKRRSVLYFPYSTLFSRVKGHKGSPVLPRLLPSIVMGSLLRRAHFESLRAGEAATINQLKCRSRSCITGNIALGAWSRANKALGCASCFIGSRPRPRAIFPVMHSHGTNLTSI